MEGSAIMTKEKAIRIVNRLLRDEFAIMTQMKTARVARKIIALLQEYDIVKPLTEEPVNASPENTQLPKKS